MLSVNFAPIAKAFFVLASLCITIPMFRVILAAAVSVRRGGPVRVTGSPRAPIVVVSLIGFLLGGLCSFFFFFPRLAGLSLGTRVVVAHFHLFFIVF